MSRRPIALFFSFLACSTAAARAETLNVLIWEKYISPAVVERWKEETGVEIRQIFFDNGDDRDRLMSDPQSEIDLVILNESSTRRLARSGLIVEVSESNVPTIANSVPRWRDRCVGRALPYFWGTVGIVYRPDKVAAAPTSWNDLLKPSPEMRGHVAMVSGFDDVMTPSLVLNGKSVNSEDETDLKGAYEILKAQAPSVRTYTYIVTSSQDETYGSDLFMALGYSGDQFVLAESSSNPWRYVVPKEGTVVWVDCFAAMAHSRRKDLALQFLNFINRPEVAARNAVDMSMPTTNRPATDLLPAAMRNDLQIFPPQAILDASQFYEEPSAKVVQLRKRIANSLFNYHDAQ